MLLVASFARNAEQKQRIWPFAALTLLVTAALLTKTTVAVLIPAVTWVAWKASSESSASSLTERQRRARGWRAFFRALVAVAVAPLALLKLWALLVSWLGYGADYNYFFTVNAMPDIDSAQTLHWLHDLAVNGLWIDRVLYPLALTILLASIAFKRRLWRNPLFAASWLAIAGQAAFIFSRQDDYAPRLLLPSLCLRLWSLSSCLHSTMLSAFVEERVPHTSRGNSNNRRLQLPLPTPASSRIASTKLYSAARDVTAAVSADRAQQQLMLAA